MRPPPGRFWIASSRQQLAVSPYVGQGRCRPAFPSHTGSPQTTVIVDALKRKTQIIQTLHGSVACIGH